MCKKLLCLMTLVLLLGLVSNASADLIGHWKMDEANWTESDPPNWFTTVEAYDSSAYSNDATVDAGTGGGTADTILAEDRPYSYTGNRAGDFGGGGSIRAPINATVSSPSLEGLGGNGQLSVAMWVKPDAPETHDHYFLASHGQINDTDESFNMWIIKSGVAASNRINFRLQEDDGAGGTINRVYQSTFTVPMGTWSHVAVVADVNGVNSGIRFYLDGVLKTTLASLQPNIHTTAALLNLGSRPGGGWGIEGALDDAQIYDHALTDTEVAAIVPEPATVALLGLGGLALLRRRRTC